MNDIVERLREGVFGTDEAKTDDVLHAYMHRAADEIERLRKLLVIAENNEARACARLAEAETLLREAGGAVVAAILADEDTASQKPWIGCWPISYTYLRGRIDAFLEGSHEKAD